MLLGLAMWACISPVQAQPKKCDQLRDEIESRLRWPKGSYQLQILPRQEDTPGKFLGQCEAGSRKIVALRTGSDAAADAPRATKAEVPAVPTPSPAVAPAPAEPAPAVVAAAPAPPPVTIAAPAEQAATQPTAPQPAAVPLTAAASAAAEAAQRRLTVTVPERINVKDTLEIKVSFQAGDQPIEARLKSPGRGVTVVPDEPVPPDPDGESPQHATWTWYVTPEKTGKLTLDIALMPTHANGQAARPVVRTVRTVEVESTLMQDVTDFASQHFQWLWTAILLPVAGLWWRSRQPKAAGAAKGG